MTRPIQELIGKVKAMRDLSSLLREGATTTAANDVPDILEIAASIISTVIPAAGANADKEVDENILRLDSLLNAKENAFMTKMEGKLNKLTGQIEQYQKRYYAAKEKLQQTQDHITEIHQKVLDADLEKQNQAIAKQEEEWDAEREALQQEEKRIYADIEKNIAEKLSEISKQYADRLEEADNNIKASQITLQNMIHEKHQQNRLKSEALSNEERRMAAEHERISREFQQRKIEAQQKTKEYNEKITKLQEEINNEDENSKTKLKRMEENLIADHKKIEEEHKAELDEVTMKVNLLNSELIQKSLDFDKLKIETAGELRDLNKEYEQKLKECQDETDKLIKRATDELKEEYRVYFEEISAKISEEEKRRGVSLDGIRKTSLESIESGEREIKELNARHQQEMEKLQAKLEEAKNKLQGTREMMEADILELKTQRTKEFGTAMNHYEEVERDQAEQINNFMRDFDQQQRKLSELHQASIESRNKAKAAEIKRLKAEHEARKNQILEEVQRQMEEDAEKELNERLEKANLAQSGDVGNLKLRLSNMMNRSNALFNRMDNILDNATATLEGIEGEESAHGIRSPQRESENKVKMRPPPIRPPRLPAPETVNEGKQGLKKDIDAARSGVAGPEDRQKKQLKADDKELFASMPAVAVGRKQSSTVKQTAATPLANDKGAFRGRSPSFVLRNSQNTSARERIMSEQQEIERRRDIVMNEAHSIDTNIRHMHDTFERRIQQVEMHYNATRSTLQSQTRSVLIRKEEAQKKLSEQQSQLQKLVQKAEEVQAQADDLDNNFERKKEEFAEVTKHDFEAKVAEAAQPVREFEEEMQNVKETLGEQLHSLNEQLLAAKANTEKISRLLMKEREVRLEETEMQLRLEHEEKMEILTQKHEARIAAMDDELEMARQQAEESIRAKEHEANEKSLEEHIKFNKMIDELVQEQENLTKEGEELEKEIEDLTSKECGSCVAKKAIIKQLLEKRDILQKRIDALHKEQQVTEVKMNSMFGSRQTSPRIYPVSIGKRAQTSIARIRQVGSPTKP